MVLYENKIVIILKGVCFEALSKPKIYNHCRIHGLRFVINGIDHFSVSEFGYRFCVFQKITCNLRTVALWRMYRLCAQPLDEILRGKGISSPQKEF